MTQPAPESETFGVPEPEPRTVVRGRRALGKAVANRVRPLQRLSLQDVPAAVRTLAVLRRAVGSPPGSDPEIWAETIDLVPEDEVGRGDDPSPSELAAHHAMTLFALHRQGRCAQAHVDNVAPGTAFVSVARKRGGGEADSEGVRRRFDALVTASRPEEAAHHLRGLVLLARSEDVGFDYGYLADDLRDLWSQSPRARHQVRLRWARQYRGFRPAAEPEPTSPTNPQE